MAVVKATIATLRDDFNLADIKTQCEKMTKQAVDAGVRMERDVLSDRQKDAVCNKFHKVVLDSLDARFSDAITSLCEVSE